MGASRLTETWLKACEPSEVSQYHEVEEELLLGATAASLSSSSGIKVVEDTVVVDQLYSPSTILKILLQQLHQ